MRFIMTACPGCGHWVKLPHISNDFVGTITLKCNACGFEDEVQIVDADDEEVDD